MRKKNITETRLAWKIQCVEEAKAAAMQFLSGVIPGDQLHKISFGLPEVDDRYMIWRVPIRAMDDSEKVGEVVIDAPSGEVQKSKTTRADVLIARLSGTKVIAKVEKQKKKGPAIPILSKLPNTVALGDAEDVLSQLPECSIDLVFYCYNAFTQALNWSPLSS